MKKETDDYAWRTDERMSNLMTRRVCQWLDDHGVEPDEDSENPIEAELGLFLREKREAKYIHDNPVCDRIIGFLPDINIQGLTEINEYIADHHIDPARLSDQELKDLILEIASRSDKS